VDQRLLTCDPILVIWRSEFDFCNPPATCLMTPQTNFEPVASACLLLMSTTLYCI